MLQARSDIEGPADDSGFTLFEMLVVMTIMVLAASAVLTRHRGPSNALEVKTAALVTSSRLRDLRVTAMANGDDAVAVVDTASRVVRFSDGSEPLALNRALDIAVTGAAGERVSSTTAGVRFFPNGSSTGATITLKSERQTYEVRVNWLTGRVSTIALD